jgi:hypothetical protein
LAKKTPMALSAIWDVCRGNNDLISQAHRANAEKGSANERTYQKDPSGGGL